MFFVSFIFTTGVAVLGVLLWVRPEEIFALVMIGVFSSCVFVLTFAALRMLVLHILLDEYPDKEEDPGMKHHLAKSFIYGFLALVLAVVLTGILAKMAVAQTPPVS
jgi:ABC-type Fe3+ transport system permease subunit